MARNGNGDGGGNRPVLVVESLVRGKWDDPVRCEDVAVLDGPFVAVFDGATDKSGVRYDGRSPGRFAADIGAAALAALPPEAGARAAIDHVATALAEAVAAVAPGTGRPDMPPCFAMVVYSRHRHEIWRVGDCPFGIDDRADEPTSPIDRATIAARAAYLHSLIAQGATVESLVADDPSRPLLAPMFRAQCALVNRTDDNPYAYGAIDGSPVPDRFVEVVPVPAGARSVVLASDGYPELLGTLAQTEQALARLLAADPLCIRLRPNTKGIGPGQISFDDRAYVRLAIGP